MATSSNEELLQAHAELCSITFGYLKSMALECAIRFGIPNAIYRRGGAASLPDLLAALPVPESKKPYLPRLMRFLAASGIFVVDAPGTTDEHADGGATATYRLTPLSRLLVDDDGTGAGADDRCAIDLSPFVLSQTNRYHVTAALHLPEWFESDAAAEMPFKTAHGADPWTVFSRDPKINRVFNAGMAADTRFAMSFVVSNYGDAFDGVTSLVDVAGGTGTAARAIARAFPRIKCAVLDLPSVIDSVPADGVVEYVAGDMMSSIPKADAVFLKYVLHDWNDEDCVRILTQCRKAIPKPGGKVIIVDMVVGSPSNAAYEAQVLFDLLMMVMTAGKERDEREWSKIFMDAGFSHHKTRPVLGSFALIELYP
uniref:Uncharacterized protein n=1 Tax=Avena sativa TaxID=4498 RepID=A0ACD5YLC7_AVESA